MTRAETTVAILATGLLALPVVAGGGGWVDFVDETSVRMPTPLNDPGISTNDPDEKDYAVGDVDMDGDLDLVCVRKEDFTSTGRRANVLFMNEGIAEGHAIDGVLVDRTDDYVAEFNTATNDRDVVLVDVDLDGWLDMVTATTLTDNSSKTLSHPRVYMNLGEIGGDWQGFQYEEPRIPQMHATAGPRFCSVAAGDLTGDGYPDLYFGDYDSGGGQIFDYNNKLLINDGSGFFSDETDLRLGAQFNYGGGVGFDDLAFSAFGAASVIADMNGDGYLDVIKQTSLAAPTHVAITHNNPSDEGMFTAAGYVQYDQNAPYFVNAGDLNNDGKLDMVVTDDGNDRYYLNTTIDPNGNSTFSSFSLGSITGGFGGDSYIEDLNNDGFNDVIITDVDVDIPGCSRTTRIFRNLGNVPNITLQVQGEVIPNSQLTGVHNAAVFDINGDGWKDIVMGRCNGTQVWMNVPPTGLAFSYADGVPGGFRAPGQTHDIEFTVSGIGGAQPEAGSGQMFLSVNDGPFNEISLSGGGNTYTGTLPAGECNDVYRIYVTADMQGGGTFTDPPNAPAITNDIVIADGEEELFRDTIEGDVSAWQVVNDPSLTTGAWEQADPIGTINGGDLAAPDDDATNGADNVMCFVTENGIAGGSAGAADVDGGPTHLISPVFDASNGGTISFDRWFYSSGGDSLTVSISNNGGTTWIPVPEVTATGPNSGWVAAAFDITTYVPGTANMRVRFTTSDSPNDSITEAGIDNFAHNAYMCEATSCPGDVDGDGMVNTTDMLALLGEWGVCGGCASDFNGDGMVDTGDLLVLLGAWGPCP